MYIYIINESLPRMRIYHLHILQVFQVVHLWLGLHWGSHLCGGIYCWIDGSNGHVPFFWPLNSFVNRFNHTLNWEVFDKRFNWPLGMTRDGKSQETLEFKIAKSERFFPLPLGYCHFFRSFFSALRPSRVEFYCWSYGGVGLPHVLVSGEHPHLWFCIWNPKVSKF